MFKYSTIRSLCVILLFASPVVVVEAAQICNLNYKLTKPDSRYTYNTQGDEVIDTVTGLVWKRCLEGQIWEGSTCIGKASIFTWEQALAHAATKNGWRLANINELYSLAEPLCFGPAMNQAAFPGEPALNVWSSTPAVSENNSVWLFDAMYGRTHFYFQSKSQGAHNSVRLVRSQ